MNVREETERVARYGQRVEALLDSKELRLSDDRDVLLTGYWNLLLDYHTATVTLLPLELHGAAFALQRPIIEVWVRVHVVKTASDETLLRIKDDTYRVDFARVGEEIDKAFGLRFFENSLSKSVRDALHSYTHSGSFQIARRFQGYSDGAILTIVEGSMTALFMATILVTKHFGFEEEWRAATQMFNEYNRRPPEVPK